VRRARRRRARGSPSSDSLWNTGSAAPATTTRFYLSTNTIVDAADTVLGARAIAALTGGGPDNGSIKVTIPAGTAPGMYYLLAKADADDVAREIVETNNVAARALQVTP
jgi:subtilase family serine protease